MSLHVLVPGLVALAAAAWARRGPHGLTSWREMPWREMSWRELWPDVRRPWWIMLATMAVDLDHLLADPWLDPDRCSIGFHPLHTAPAIAVYAMLCLWPRSRWWGVGLLIHMALDWLDCFLMH